MRMLLLIRKTLLILALFILTCVVSFAAPVEVVDLDQDMSIDRIQLVTQQINLLKNRLSQSERELSELQQEHDKQISQFTMTKASKNLLDKVSLDISVSKSNLDSLNIELTDSQQTVSWLEKNIQEIDNQLNVLTMFGSKMAGSETVNTQELRTDVQYQKKLLLLEKSRVKYLQNLQATANSILQLKKEDYSRISALLKSYKMLHIKQQQVKDELAYQEKQNYWLEQLNVLYARLAKVDPAQSKEAYASLERSIFYANENANYAYVQALIARYTDQIQQMKLAIYKNDSISLLNEMGDQVLALNKQIDRLDAVLKARITVLEKHINYLAPKKKNNADFQTYVGNLADLKNKYQIADEVLLNLDKNLSAFRVALDKALQTELSSRQGFPTFGFKMLLDIGKEMLLVPALTFQIMKSLSTYLMHAFYSTSLLMWSVFALTQLLLVSIFFFLNKLLKRWLSRPSEWHEKINSKWLGLAWLKRNYIDLALFGNFVAIMFFFGVPPQNYMFIVYLAMVWLIFKSILTFSRLCLVETTHDTAGSDVKLFHRLKWIILVGGIIVALTVFVHQLPLIYELKTLCDRLFLLFLMIGSLLLLRTWHVVPNLILSQMDSHHPYLRNSVRLIGILIPILLFGNSVIGLIGFVNLIMTVSWYEGIFLFVLVGYLILRGLLSDGMEQLSRLVIQYASNGWLWTEAFLKPLDKVFRIALFLMAWAALFLLYGWDQQSPIVERLTRLLHYQLVHALNTTITPISMIELFVVISVFYWTAKWTREFVYRLLSSRTTEMGIKNSIAILTQYSVIVLGIFICLRVLGIDLRALAFVASMFAFGVGLGLRDLANNFACGFLILLERPLRIGDIVSINNIEGEVTHIGSRAITVRTWDHMELLVPNAEIFNKSFTNWTARDNIVRTVVSIKISRYDNPHEVKVIIYNVLSTYKDVLKDPMPEVFLKEMNATFMEFELRYFVNIRQVKSRTSVVSAILMNIWDVFAKYGIKPPYPQHEIFLRSDTQTMGLLGNAERAN